MNTKKMSLLALFVALSIIGAMIKIPAIVGSVALDAFPALVVVVLLGTRSGMFVAAMGHLMSSLIVGMPLGPMHLFVAVEMAVIVWIFGVLYQSGKKWIACIVFIILNGIIAPLPFALLLSLPFYISLVPSVLVGSALNGVLALIFIQRFEPFLQKKLVGILNES